MSVNPAAEALGALGSLDLSGAGGAGDSSGARAGGAGGSGISTSQFGTININAAPAPSPSPGTSNPSAPAAGAANGAAGAPGSAAPNAAVASSRPSASGARGAGASSSPTDTADTTDANESPSPSSSVIPSGTAVPSTSGMPRISNTPASTGNNTISINSGSNGRDDDSMSQLSNVAIVGIAAACVLVLALFFTAIICCCVRRRRRRRRLRREKSQTLGDAPMVSYAAVATASQEGERSLSAFTPSPTTSGQAPTLQSIMTSPSLDFHSAPPPVYPGLVAPPDDARQLQQQHAYPAQEHSASGYPLMTHAGQIAPGQQQGHHEVHGQDARVEASGDTHLPYELHSHPCGTVVYELPCEQKR
ncbi:hypothetical protein HRG_000100 [Hirsutella rhossiliensis]|uniref:Uncharacterized protein n=1 Tax=Hirsutella rhossiliensis TaxID=111463 RepID=A0A9P8SLG6_9HYPO|nr:uncharacterized protein HRG_00100 [Hirsutella rhossiliensis]KAH0967458.1 hypothetical protein HRG_00100 [Hirsutella rhossiliensis]